MINVTQSDGALLLNGEITIDLPEFVRGDRVVVHGLSGILSVLEMPSEEEATAVDSPNHGFDDCFNLFGALASLVTELASRSSNGAILEL